MVAVGKEFTVTVVGVEVAEQLVVFVTVKVYEPEAAAVYVAPVAFVIAPDASDHWYVSPVPVFAERITEPPVQNVVAEPAVMLAAGKLFTVITFPVDVPVHVPLLTVTAQVPAAVAVQVAFVALAMVPDAFDHWYVKFVPVFAESMIEPPVQKLLEDDVIVAV